MDNNSSSYSARGCATINDIRYTKFRISGIVGDKHAIFVPSSLQLTRAVFGEVCEAINKEAPSALITGAGSVVHPSQLSTEQLRRCPDFQPLVNEAREKLGMPPVKATTGVTPRESETKIAGIVDTVLEKKLVSMVSNISSAAARTNVWTLSGPQISSFEVLLQQAIINGERDMTSMAVVHLQDRAYMESELAKEMLHELFDNSEDTTSDNVDNFQPLELPGDLWDPAASTHQDFAKCGYDSWSFSSLESAAARGHPITQWPWPYAEIFVFFYQEEKITGSSIGEVDWHFRTTGRLDPESVPFQAESIARPAYVFIGDPMKEPKLFMKSQMIRSIKSCDLMVLMNNTPNAVKQMSLLVNIIKRAFDRSALSSCLPFLVEGGMSSLSTNPKPSELLQAFSPAKVLRQLEKDFDCQAMDVDERLALSDVVSLLDQAKLRPQTFKDAMTVLDPLAGDLEESTNQLISVFTSSSGGAAGEPSWEHRSLVLKGWSLHHKLHETAERLSLINVATNLGIASMLFLSTFLAMYLANAYLEGQDVPAKRPLQFLVLLLPVCIGVAIVAQNSCQVAVQWASAHVAASRVVMEIYHFLGKVEPYTGEAAANQKKLTKRLHDITTGLAGSGVRGAGLQDSATEGTLAEDLGLLQLRIDQSLYRASALVLVCRKARNHLASLCGLATAWVYLSVILEDHHEHVDPTLPVSAETYMETRVAPLIRYYSDRIQTLSRLRLLLNCGLLVCLSAAVGLGATGASIWVPVALAMVTLLSTLMQLLTPQNLFTAINAAMTTLNNLDIQWQGSEKRERRTEVRTKHLVVLTEQVAMAVARVDSRDTSMQEAFADEREDDAEDCEMQSMQLQSRGKETSPKVISALTTPLCSRSGVNTPCGH